MYMFSLLLDHVSVARYSLRPKCLLIILALRDLCVCVRVVLRDETLVRMFLLVFFLFLSSGRFFLLSLSPPPAAVG